MKTVILIGGAPTVGKSTAAKELSKLLQIPYTSTDHIRDDMRETKKPEDFPELFATINPTAEMAVEYNSPTLEEIVKKHNLENEDVWVGVEEYITKSQSDYFIIEGVAVLPHLVVRYKQDGVTLKPFFITHFNKEKIRDIIYTRGLWGEPDEYPDSVKEKEVAWVIAFSELIEKEAKKYSMPVITFDTKDTTSANTIALLLKK